MFNKSTYITVILLIALSVFELLAQFFLKLSLLDTPTHHIDWLMSFIKSFGWNKTTQMSVFMFIGMIIYGFTGYLFRESLKYKGFGIVGLLWHIMMTLLTILISVFIFSDTYTTRDIIGVILGIGSMVLLLSNGHNH